MLVEKRDGVIEQWDTRKIMVAISEAAKAAGEDEYTAHSIADQISTKVVSKFSGKEKATVDEIQEAVENTLLVSKYKAIGKKYIEYRKERDIAREAKSKWAKLGLDITSGEDTESQRENSNVPRGTITTQIEMIKRNYSRQFVKDYILPKRFLEAHERGDIHVNDLQDAIVKIPNCSLMHYPYMLQNGFQLGNKWIEEPTSILTAMNILVQMVQVQSVNQFGGLTLADIDVHLGKYVIGSYKKFLVDAILDLDEDCDEQSAEERLSYCEGNIHPENKWIIKYFKRENDIAIRKTKRETYKACKLLSYQINTLQVRGESSPFTTIGYGNSTTWEGRLLQQSILNERSDEFDRSGTQEFPKHMMAIRAGINLNPEDPNYDLFKLANKVSAKTCYPDYIFPENQEKHTGGSAFYMG